MREADGAAAKELVASIADDLPVGIWAARAPTGELLYANRTFAEIMGMGARDDVAAGQYAEPYGIYDRKGALYPEDQMPFMRALRERRTVTVDDIVIHRADGARVNIRAQARPVFDGDDQLTHIVIAFIDISREVAAERVRDNFLSVASHELRTPIATLQLKVQAMLFRCRNEADAIAERMTEWLSVCDHQVRRLAALSNQLLDVSRIQAGRFELDLEEIDLIALLRTSMALFSEQSRHEGTELQLDGPWSLQGRFDVHRVEHIVTNVLSNAVKYGRGHPVVMTVATTEDRVRIEIRDHGIGIAPEDHLRIFQPFERAVSPRSYGGLGLGLWIAHQSAAKIGGSIRVESERAGGAKFIVELPWLR